jgi:hypothetical protein
MVKHCKDCDCEEREAFYQTFDDQKPFIDTEIDENGNLIRNFPNTTEAHLLKWHTDEEDRIVYSLNTNDWLFQFDNELPIPIKPYVEIEIKRGVFHRIIKGSTDLILKIKKCQ